MEKGNKTQKLYYSIGEVAELLGENPSLIRYWEQQFEELKPKRTGGGTRHFTRDDIVVLKAIHGMLKQDGLTIKGAKEKLRERNRSLMGNEETIRLLEELKEFLLNLERRLPITDSGNEIRDTD